MKNKLTFLFCLTLLASCGANPGVSSSSQAPTPSLESSSEVISKEESTSTPASQSSMEISSESSSEAPSSLSSSSEATSKEESTTVTLNSTNILQAPAQGYPSGEFTIDEITFYSENVMNGKGKLSDKEKPYIQFKKEVGFISTATAIKAPKIVVTAYSNYNSYTSVDMLSAPIVLGSANATFDTTTSIAMIKETGSREGSGNEVVFEYEVPVESLKYFQIKVGSADYALYAKEISITY